MPAMPKTRLKIDAEVYPIVDRGVDGKKRHYRCSHDQKNNIEAHCVGYQCLGTKPLPTT